LIEKLTIITKDLTTERLDLSSPFAWAQRAVVQAVENQVNANVPVRIIVLKARQLGISTICQGIVFNWCFMYPGANGLIIAHENDASQSLYEKSQMFWETWPFHDLYTAKHATQKRMTWLETRSSLRIATAKNVQSGRSRTLQAIHASECAIWEDPETLMVGLRQSLPNTPGTMLLVESTANGVGNWFHKTWLDAVAGNNDYLPLFFPWWKHPEYRLPITTLEHLELEEDERLLMRMGAPPEAIEWRRYAIPNLCQDSVDEFQQEYPATPREAFLTTGRNVFPIKALEECFKPKAGARGYLTKLESGELRFAEDPGGNLTIFKWPSRDKSWGQYFVSGDPSRTTMGDNACCQVINRSNFEQVAVWHGKIDPIAFARIMAQIGYFYNTAELSPEIEGPGYATIGALVEMGYPKLWNHRWADKHQGKVAVSLGWSTNYQRKHWAMGKTVSMLSDHSIILHDQETFDQMCNYVVLDNGEMGNSSRWSYDDAVMAFAIAIICSVTEGPVRDVSDAPMPRSDIMGVPPWEAFDSANV
jgi:hypothetical protein